MAIVLLGRLALRLFLPPASEAVEIARHLNHIAIWSFLFFGMTFVVSGVVRSTGAVVPPLLMLGLALWGVRVPFAKFGQAWFGADGLWWAFPVSSAVSMALSLAYYRWGGWRRAHMLEPHQAEPVAAPAGLGAQPTAVLADPPPEADAGGATRTSPRD